MVTGGVCLVFDIIEELKLVFKDDREVAERLVSSIKPD